jgi:general secretion pathway protein K
MHPAMRETAATICALQWRRFPCGGSRAQCGFALVAVLWVMAAAVVGVTGVLFAVREQVRTVSWQKEQITAAAVSDAVAVLFARDLAAAPAERDGLLRSHDLEFEGRTVRIEVVPLSGLVDINLAPETLLADLFEVAGGVDRDVAVSLAQRVVDWRDGDDRPLPQGAEDPDYVAAPSRFRTRGGDFEAPEDLLQVLGVDFELYSRVSRLISVESGGGGQVNPAAAPPDVLRVLARGNADLDRDYARARAVDGRLADTTRFPAEHRGDQVGTKFLLVSRTPLSNGAQLVTRRVVEFGPAVNGIPWLTLRLDRVVEAPEAS